jgi:hypothetical protein
VIFLVLQLLAGHTSTYGCRICPIRRVHGANGYGQYFVPNSETLFLPWWPNETFFEGLLKVGKGVKGKRLGECMNLIP